MGPWFIVSPEGMEKHGIEPMTLVLQVELLYHYAIKLPLSNVLEGAF